MLNAETGEITFDCTGERIHPQFTLRDFLQSSLAVGASDFNSNPPWCSYKLTDRMLQEQRFGPIVWFEAERLARVDLWARVPGYHPRGPDDFCWEQEQERERLEQAWMRLHFNDQLVHEAAWGSIGWHYDTKASFGVIYVCYQAELSLTRRWWRFLAPS